MNCNSNGTELKFELILGIINSTKFDITFSFYLLVFIFCVNVHTKLKMCFIFGTEKCGLYRIEKKLYIFLLNFSFVFMCLCVCRHKVHLVPTQHFRKKLTTIWRPTRKTEVKTSNCESVGYIFFRNTLSIYFLYYKYMSFLFVSVGDHIHSLILAAASGVMW